MSQTVTITNPITPTDTPRARRGAAAVVAQYIQDLTNPTSVSAAAA